ncbi:hypothetical protein LIER_05247 [Lithospermum erythrorhizon]|uniref:Uncharacterized protein n=1 Tax=Lithospermum erythrorhizon TaxID=34254 RepID=A0AAV3P059_LITER
MKGKRIPLFKRAGVVTKTAPETSAPAFAGGSLTDLDMQDGLDLTKESLPSASLGDTSAPLGGTNVFEAPFTDTPIVSGGFSKGKKSDSAPKVITGYSATYLNVPYTLPGSCEVIEKSKLGTVLDAFRATRPLLLKGIGKPYEEFIDPLELQGVIAKHLVKATNASHVLARRVDRLDVDVGLSREGERASQFRVQELEKENEDLLRNQETVYKEKKIATNSSEAFYEELGEETAYCLCHFVKTFKNVNPSMAAHYQEFISGYPSRWFSSLDINAPLSPMEGGESDAVPGAQDSPQA